MPEYKINFFFKDSATGTGWSETYYDSQPAPGNAMNVANLVATLRGPLLGAGAALTEVRISDIAIQGDSLVNTQIPYVPLDPTQVADTPWQTVLCRLNSGTLYRSHIFIRGIPDSIINPETAGDKVFALGWTSSLTNYLSYLSNRFDILAVDKDPLTAPAMPITAIAAGAGGTTVTLTAAPPIPFTIGDPAKIYNIRESPTLAGVYRVIAQSSVAPWTVTLSVPFPGTFPYLGRSYLRLHRVAPFTISSGQIIRYTTHRVGRVFGQPVGRRKRRLILPR